jgi:hypothetical protein
MKERDIRVSSFGLVSRNALVLSGLANFRVVGKPELMARLGLLALFPHGPSSAQNRNNSGKRISTTLHGSHCLDRCLLRLVLVNNRT